MKAKIIFQVGLLCLIGGAQRLPAACRTTTAATANTEIKVIVPFAIAVGIPVAPLAPYFYSYQAAQDRGVRIEERESPSILAPRSSLLTQHCSACHSGAAPKAGLSLESIDTVALANRLRAVRAVASGRMPKGESLSADEIRALIQELTDPNRRDAESQR
jgi:hypothetical protein